MSSRQGRAANNCTTCFSVFKHKSDVISITISFASASLIGIELGAPPHEPRPNPMCDEDEFCVANVIVIEPQRCEITDFAVK
jgi:hypothetical protein